MRTTLAERIRKQKITSVISSVSAFLIVLVICSILFSALSNALEMNSSARLLLAGLSVSAGTFAASYTLAKRRRQGGILLGLLVGIAVFAAVFIGTLILGGAFTAGGVLSKLVIIVVCAVIGGVVGVNGKMKI
jgi:putative membrane protein (TIGR04086 family)